MGELDTTYDDAPLRRMSAREFVRRFRKGVANDEKTYAWMIGAGCSVSSGVEAAAECARVWIQELKYLETGMPQDVEAWAARRFVGYDPEDPASVYGDVMSAMFHQQGDRRHAIQMLTKSAEPGFGYATLAQLMTHAKWGGRTSLALTTNFDDMLSEALYVYSQKRPQTIAQEALGPNTPLFPDTPTVLKLHGDAHLPDREHMANRPRYREDVRDRLREVLADACLIIVGYGGREESFLDMLEGLPPSGPAGGVYWVNEAEPRGAFGDWLERVGAVWVPQSDFDELMYCVRVEFGLGHPKIERFHRVFRKYNAQYRNLSTRSGLHIAGTPSQDGEGAEPQAIAPPKATPGGVAPEEADGAGAAGLGRYAMRRETDLSRRERLRQSLNAYSETLKKAAANAPERPPSFSRGAPADVNDLLVKATKELHGGAGSAAPGYGDAFSADGGGARDDGRGGGSFNARSHDVVARDGRGGDDATQDGGAFDRAAHSRGPYDQGRRIRRSDLEAIRGNGDGALADDQRARRTQEDDEGRDEDRIAGVDPLLDADEIGLPQGGPDDVSSSPRRGAAGLTAREAAPGADAKPEDRAAGLARIGRLLVSSQRGGDAEIPGDALADSSALPAAPTKRLPVSQANFGEARFLGAIEAAPQDPALRTRYAQFLAVGVGDLRRAEAEFEEAQQLAPNNVAVLRDYAAFALDQLRDVRRAERLLAKALDHDLRNAETLRSLADFLVRAHGDVEEAESCLRLAMEVQPTNPRNFIEFADFLLRRRGRREEAEGQLRRAAEIRPESPAALAELAVFRATVTHELDAAQQCLARASRIGPSDPEVAFARAVISERKGDLDDAEAHFRRATDAQRGGPDLRAMLAFAEFLKARRGDLDGAESLLRSAIEMAPYRAAPFTAYGRFLSGARGQGEAAERALRDAVAAEPYDAPALTALAEHLAANGGDADEVEDLFKDALAVAPRSADILRAFGLFLSEMRGQPEAAEAQFRAAIEIEPQAAENFDAMATFMHEVRKDADEAEIYFREALKLAPNRAETLNRFAGFLRQTKRDLDEAETFYRRALDANPRDAQSLARSAQFLLSKGRRAEGLKVLNDAFDAAWRMDHAVRPGSLMLELWIYRYAHDPARREESLKAAIALIEAGVRCEGWDLGPTVREAISAGHPDPDIVQDLAAVATEGLDPGRLLRRA